MEIRRAIDVKLKPETAHRLGCRLQKLRQETPEEEGRRAAERFGKSLKDIFRGL